MQEYCAGIDDAQIIIPKSEDQLEAASELIAVVGGLPLSGRELELLSAAVIKLTNAAVLSGLNFGIKITAEFARTGGEIGKPEQNGYLN